ncbi:hypothetical protein QJS04_geneDACA015304 [Acorus gramineus]|uniref:Cupin type-1 domain-containing protein n=1 Tax=Acorus gramineus TaxID=55184 RepID=A0AAV9ASV5_ACOGR|nr:hypothetical protein QJS04_geneDACA015304 [Acorus gramineus]
MNSPRLLLLLSFFAFVLVADITSAYQQGSRRASQDPRQCRIQRLTASRPSRKIQSEGGVTELWDENEEQFQCAGVAAMRNVIQPNSLSLPNYSPSPRLVYVHKGQGLLGISYPGCAETYDSGEQEEQQEEQGQEEQQRRRRGGEGRQHEEEQEEEEKQRRQRGRRGEEGRKQREEQQEQEEEEEQKESWGQQGRRRGSRGDQHQKIHRIRHGEVVALPAGAAHWCFNDGNEELVTVSITDVNSQWNQLDQTPWSFYLAGGQPSGIRKPSERESEREGQREREQEGSERERESEKQRRKRESESEGSEEEERSSFNAQNILSSFDANMIAQAFNVPNDIARKLTREDNRGFIVKVQRGGMGMIKPDEEQQQERGRSTRENGLEETFCNMRLNQYLDNPREADIYSRQAGRLNSVNMHKLPILRYLDLSAEKTNLNPNSIVAPHWSMNAHTILYITKGDGNLQVVGSNGRSVFNERVSEGQMVVVPQYFASAQRAGRNGVEWVAFKTSALPMKSPLAGHASVFKGLPLQVITNSYRISNQQAQQLKQNREHQHLLFPPSRTTSMSS